MAYARSAYARTAYARGDAIIAGAGGTTFSVSVTEALTAIATTDATVTLGASSSFVAIAGIVVPILEGHAVERYDYRSTSTPMFPGNLRAIVKPEKLAWEVTTGLMTLTEAATLKAAIALGAQVGCVGVGLPTGGATCVVTWRNGAYVNTSAADGSGLLRSFVLVLRQVS